MRKLFVFKADWSEVNKYRGESGTNHGESFYSIANAGSVPFLTNTIAEYYDCSGKPIPTPGYRLTETVPEDRDSFRDSGWEVVEVEEYTPEIPAPYGAKFNSICICYCVYKPLSPEDEWTKKAHRLSPSLASFRGDEEAYKAWLESQSAEMQKDSLATTQWLKTQEKQPTEV
jgi:hypothetical protein